MAGTKKVRHYPLRKLQDWLISCISLAIVGLAYTIIAILPFAVLVWCILVVFG